MREFESSSSGSVVTTTRGFGSKADTTRPMPLVVPGALFAQAASATQSTTNMKRTDAICVSPLLLLPIGYRWSFKHVVHDKRRQEDASEGSVPITSKCCAGGSAWVPA